VSDIAKVPMGRVLKEVVPYFLGLIVALGLITFFPSISTYIPNLFIRK
jgi:TRAP-type C4-dicarboxylate transport system permease large subunit